MYEHPQFVEETANALLDHVFSNPRTLHHQSQLMGLLPRVLVQENPLASYSAFFQDQSDPEMLVNNFAWEIEDVV